MIVSIQPCKCNSFMLKSLSGHEVAFQIQKEYKMLFRVFFFFYLECVALIARRCYFLLIENRIPIKIQSFLLVTVTSMTREFPASYRYYLLVSAHKLGAGTRYNFEKSQVRTTFFGITSTRRDSFNRPLMELWMRPCENLVWAIL